MTLYSNTQVENFLASAEDNGCYVTQLNEGSLLGGDYLIEKDGYKTMLITEKYLNEWSGAYQIRKFSTNSEKSMARLNKLVQKLQVIEDEE